MSWPPRRPVLLGKIRARHQALGTDPDTTPVTAPHHPPVMPGFHDVSQVRVDMAQLVFDTTVRGPVTFVQGAPSAEIGVYRRKRDHWAASSTNYHRHAHYVLAYGHQPAPPMDIFYQPRDPDTPSLRVVFSGKMLFTFNIDLVTEAARELRALAKVWLTVVHVQLAIDCPESVVTVPALQHLLYTPWAPAWAADDEVLPSTWTLPCGADVGASIRVFRAQQQGVTSARISIDLGEAYLAFRKVRSLQQLRAVPWHRWVPQWLRFVTVEPPTDMPIAARKVLARMVRLGGAKGAVAPQPGRFRRHIRAGLHDAPLQHEITKRLIAYTASLTPPRKVQPPEW